MSLHAPCTRARLLTASLIKLRHPACAMCLPALAQRCDTTPLVGFTLSLDKGQGAGAVHLLLLLCVRLGRQQLLQVLLHVRYQVLRCLHSIIAT